MCAAVVMLCSETSILQLRGEDVFLVDCCLGDWLIAIRLRIRELKKYSDVPNKTVSFKISCCL